MRPRVTVEPGPELRRHLPGLVEPVRGAQGDELPGRVRAKQVGKDPFPVIGVVDEQQQVSEADQGVRAVGRTPERLGPAMNIADHMHPHAHTLGSYYSRSLLHNPSQKGVVPSWPRASRVLCRNEEPAGEGRSVTMR